MDKIEKKAETENVFGLDDMMRTHPFSAERAQQAAQISVESPIPSMTEEGWEKVKSLCTDAGEEVEQTSPNIRVDRPSN